MPAETSVKEPNLAPSENALFRPDPKPTPRTKAKTGAWRRVRAEKLGPCRGCGPGRSIYGISFHHLVSRSLGGDDVEENLIPLCGHGTVGCHGILENREPGWEAIAAAIRESLAEDELAYVLAKKGQDFLDRYYPLREAA